MMNIQDALVAVERRQINYLLLRSFMMKEFPKIMKALQLIESENRNYREPKGYSLTKIANKRLGFVYYVRYWHSRRILPSKWCTHTNDYAEACEFAVDNRNRLIKNYLKKNDNEVDQFFKNYYDKNSPIYRIETVRNGEVAEARRKASKQVMRMKFIPFLHKNNIKKFEEITVPVLVNFQDELLAQGMKPQTINDYTGMIGKAYKYLVRKGKVDKNPCAELPPLPVKAGDRKTHGCHEVVKLKGVFNREWDDRLSYMLNLMIYATNMRNSEIKRIRKSDIVEYHGARFIDLKESKTKNGVRLVPLHPFVYKTFMEYAKGKKAGEAVFGKVTGYYFSKAYRVLAARLGVSAETLEKNNITYYSGRHFWKTLMNSEELGVDIEEICMGHKVTGNVSKLYNHREAAGRERLAKKAGEVFEILDKTLFN